MLISVNDIPITGTKCDVLFDEKELYLDCRLLEPACFAGEIYRTGTDVRIKGRFTALVEVSCHRCTEDFGFPIDAGLDLFYREKPTRQEQEEEQIPPEELGVLHYVDSAIEMSTVAHDTIVLELPMKLLCKPDCRGLCPRCGVNRNTDECNCSAPKMSNNPFAEFFKNKK